MARSTFLFVLPFVLLVGCASSPDPVAEPVTNAPSAAPAPSRAAPSRPSTPAPVAKVPAPSKPVAKPRSSYTRLTIDSVRQEGSAAVLAGSTDLPDGCELRAEIELYTSNPDATYVGNGLDVRASGGRWSATIPFPQVAGFARGPHEASVMFTPKAQSPEVLALVGQNGERLRGRSSSKAFDFRVMEAKRRVRMAVAKRAISMPDPSAYGSEDPRRAMATLLAGWKAKRWDEIAEDATLTEDSSASERREWVDSQLGFRDLESASVGSVDRTGLIARVNAQVAYSMGSELRKETLGFVFLKVDGHANPSPNGRWRANIRVTAPGGF